MRWPSNPRAVPKEPEQRNCQQSGDKPATSTAKTETESGDRAGPSSAVTQQSPLLRLRNKAPAPRQTFVSTRHVLAPSTIQPSTSAQMGKVLITIADCLGRFVAGGF